MVFSGLILKAGRVLCAPGPEHPAERLAFMPQAMQTPRSCSLHGVARARLDLAFDWRACGQEGLSGYQNRDDLADRRAVTATSGQHL